MRQGLLTVDECNEILDAMTRTGLPTWDELLDQKTPEGIPVILEGLAQFREHLGGALTVTLPDGIGRKREVHEMYPDVIEEGLVFLKERDTRPGTGHETAG
jgi:3-dehydroquinate synthase